MTRRLYPLSELPDTLSVSAASIMGSRAYQEDCLMYQVYEDGVLGVVCDGMGGLVHGAGASACAVDAVSEYFRTYPRNPAEMPGYWRDVIGHADERVAALSDRTGRMNKCGTTVAAFFISDGRVTWASAGDSMIFLLRDGECMPLVRMHNYGLLLEERRRRGTILPEEYDVEMLQSEALISYLGMNGIDIWDCSEEPLELISGDKILLCSDGLYRELPIEKIREVFARCGGGQFERTAVELIRAVYKEKTENLDNISVLCLDYHNKNN